MDAQFGLEDQQNINQFSKLNAQLHELDSLITVQQVPSALAAWNSLYRKSTCTTGALCGAALKYVSLRPSLRKRCCPGYRRYHACPSACSAVEHGRFGGCGQRADAGG